MERDVELDGKRELSSYAIIEQRTVPQKIPTYKGYDTLWRKRGPHSAECANWDGKADYINATRIHIAHTGMRCRYHRHLICHR